MNTFQLECFITVAETLNFAKASDILNITQPAVTKQIKNLEDELNVRLFRRSTRSVELTNEGEIFLNDAVTILNTEKTAKKRFSAMSERGSIQLSIGVCSSVTMFSLDKAMKQLLKLYPECKPRFHIAPMTVLMRMLEDEQLDMIMGDGLCEVYSDSIFFRELFSEKLYLIGASDNNIGSTEPVSVEEISQMTEILLILCEPSKTEKSVAGLQRSIIGNRDQSMVCLCSSVEEVCMLVMIGCGIAVIPEHIIPPIPDIIKRPISDYPLLSFGIYCSKASHSTITDKFIDILKDTFINYRSLSHESMTET